MDCKKYVDVIMNPVRQRILQYLAVHKTGTPGELKASLTDVPQASLYRHLRCLADAGMVSVISKKSVRGALEKTYAISEKPPEVPTENTDIGNVINLALVGLQASFAGYFADEKSDPMRDMLTLCTSTLMLSDSEFEKLLRSIGELVNGCLDSEPDDKRKPRHLTIISSPIE